MMENKEQQIDQFFNHYCDVFNRALNGDDTCIDLASSLFETCFIAVNPFGVRCGQNDSTFRDAMKEGYLFYRSIGIVSMAIVSKVITVLDDFHTMVKVRWRSDFIKKDGNSGSIGFDNIYFTKTRDEQHRVFAYITGDEQAALKEAGLV